MIFAAIDLGSRKLKLKVGQYSNKKWEIFEDIMVDIKIGEEVYLYQKITQETIIDLVETLSFFKKTMEMYHTHDYKAVATSSFRKAINGLSVLDLIFHKTGIKVERIDDSLEKFLTYKAMRDQFSNYSLVRKHAMLLELNAGSADLTLYKHNKLIHNIEFDLGLKKLKYTLMDYDQKSSAPTQLLKRYIEAQVRHVWEMLEKNQPKFFLALGGDLKRIAFLFYKKETSLNREELVKLCLGIYRLDSGLRKKIEASGLDWYESAVSLIFLDVFLGVTSSNEILIPPLTLRDGLLATMAEESYGITRYKHFNEDIIWHVKSISEKYKSDEKHIKVVDEHFKRLLKYPSFEQRLEERDALIIRVSIYLHEIGKYVRSKNYAQATYDLLKDMTIFGLQTDEVLIVSEVCKCVAIENLTHNTFATLSHRIQKLLAIILVCDALDKSKNKSLSIVNVVESPFTLVLQVEMSGDCEIEFIYFQQIQEFFELAFGQKIVLEIKGD